jgi:2-hydroxychromene-2-carboxylate isomerase
VDVFFDYTCAFTYRVSRWLDALEVDVVWRPFSLLEIHRSDGGPPVWERPELQDNISLLMLAVHAAVRRGGGDVVQFRRTTFAAWHETDVRLTTDDIVGFAAAAGLDPRHLDLPAGMADLGREHTAGAQLGVFGSPTLLFAPRASVFVKLGEVPPDPQRGSELLASARRFAERHSEALEFKRP